MLGGTFGGPIGAIAGGLLGTIFGGLFKRGAPSGLQERSFLPSGEIGITSSRTRRGGNIGTIAGTLDALGQSFQDAARGLGVSLQGLSFGASFRGENLQFFGAGLPKTGFTSPTPEATNNRGAELLARLVTESLNRGGKADPFVLDQFFKAGPAGLGLSGQLEAIQSANQAIQNFNKSLSDLERLAQKDPFQDIRIFFADLTNQAIALQRDSATFARINALQGSELNKRATELSASNLEVFQSILRLGTAPDPLRDIELTIAALRKQVAGLPQFGGAPVGFAPGQFERQIALARQRLIDAHNKEVAALEAEAAALKKQADLRSTLLGLIGPGGEIFSPKGGFLGFLGQGGDIIRSG
ncbi:MAG: hypothetical protein L0Y74_05880, partial [candidate division Zixibacteria bacterium]|nr:hypothetical protein [candidate division Zixibacteria bacterium]